MFGPVGCQPAGADGLPKKGKSPGPIKAQKGEPCLSPVGPKQAWAEPRCGDRGVEGAAAGGQQHGETVRQDNDDDCGFSPRNSLEQ